jgi:hypothetical protein
MGILFAGYGMGVGSGVGSAVVFATGVPVRDVLDVRVGDGVGFRLGEGKGTGAKVSAVFCFHTAYSVVFAVIEKVCPAVYIGAPSALSAHPWREYPDLVRLPFPSTVTVSPEG